MREALDVARSQTERAQAKQKRLADRHRRLLELKLEGRPIRPIAVIARKLGRTETAVTDRLIILRREHE